MPEGDTIHRTAARLALAVEGHRLVAIELTRWPGRLPEAHELITSVDALGKHLLMSFSGGLVLHTHMKMTGSWHLYRAGEAWRRGASHRRALVVTDAWQAVCFDAPLVELTTPGRLRRVLAHLGPDLTTGVDDEVVERCVDRMARLVPPDTSVADVLRDQRVCCGVGNVYASEVCWFAGLDPSTPIDAVALDARRALVATSAELLAANLDRERRATIGGALAVYGRAGLPCRRCTTPVEQARLGRFSRVTYWCPSCQPARGRG